jgi:tetratricopeptide (TPR) repeat protein
MPDFFKAPFHFDSMVYLTCLALLSLITLFDMLVIDLVVKVILYYAIYRYGFAVLEQTAQGYLRPEEVPEGGRFGMDNQNPLRLVGIFILAGVVAGVLIHYQLSFLLKLFLLTALFVAPAIIMMLGICSNLLRSINPLALAVLIREVGWSYLALYAFLTLLFFGEYSVYALLPHQARLLATPISVWVSAYFVLVMFRLMGYVIYQNHEKLGYDVAIDFTTLLEQMESQKGSTLIHPSIQECIILLLEGKGEAARERMAAHIKNEPQHLTLQQFYHTLLLKLEAYQAMLEHAQRYAPILIDRQKWAQALTLFETCRKHDPHFGLKDAHQTVLLAQEALRQQRYQTCLNILDRFDARFTYHIDTPLAALLMAKCLCEGQGKDEKALGILRVASEKFATSAQGPELKAYCEFVEALSKKNRPVVSGPDSAGTINGSKMAETSTPEPKDKANGLHIVPPVT